VGLALAVLAGLTLVSIGVGWSAISHARSAEQSALKQNEVLAQRLARAEETNQQFQSDLHVVAGKLNVTQSDLVNARKQGKNTSVTFDKKLTGLETTMKSELATKASAEDFNRLNGDVNGVKGDLDATKNSIQMARSELGTLIARNHDEVDQLRRLGQRDYVEFTVTRKSGAQHVGSVQIQLKDTNTKKNQYTIDVLADDRSFEKKNRSVNEPIFFYIGGSRAALELVVNKVTKTTATGYLSAPKSSGAASASAASSGQ
jgi:septation ring formation regulator EzrA